MKPSFFHLFVLFSLLSLPLSCCGTSSEKVDCAYIISLKTPRQTASRFKCALLYGTDGTEVAYNCLSKNTQKRIPFWKFNLGFSLIEYDKQPELKLWRVLVDLQVKEVVEMGEKEAVLVTTSSERMTEKYRSFSEVVYVKKEGEEWKLDLEKTMKERGYLGGIDKWEREQLEGKKSQRPDGNGGCSLVKSPLGPEGQAGVLLPYLIMLLGLAWLKRAKS